MYNIIQGNTALYLVYVMPRPINPVLPSHVFFTLRLIILHVHSYQKEMSDKDEQKVRPMVSVVSGGIAGGVEACVTYPFEYAKTRAQLHVRKAGVPYPRNPFAVVGQVYSEQGLRALYKGCGALATGSIGKDAVRFLSFDTVKNAFKDPETGTLSPLRNMLAGMAAGVVASATAVTPTERIKTALIDDARASRRFPSTMHAVRTIVAEDGFKGLYRGFAGTTLKQASATSVRMGSYNILKDFEKERNIDQNTATNFANGAVAGTVSHGLCPLSKYSTRVIHECCANCTFST
jgi:solute carrier family 25 citrate transporter 1